MVNKKEVKQKGKNSDEKLKKKNNKLQLINQLFRHDIRNDLNIVKLCAENLKEKYGENEDIEKIINKTDHMYELTILARDIAKSIEKDETQSVNLADILKSCIEDCKESYPDSKIQVKGKIPDIEVKADKLLSSLFENIIQNGIQHNDKEKPKIVISTDLGKENVIVSIGDNGPGIPDEIKNKIFEPGEKKENSDGTGLGLFLVDTLISNYEGEILIEDNKPEGTKFKVKLKRN